MDDRHPDDITGTGRGPVAATPSETPPEKGGTVDNGIDDDEPRGAIVVTTFLTAVILISWFGVFALLVLRG